MTDPSNILNWAYVRSFLAVAETGSLSAAAKHTGQSQPTLGRHIRAAETALGMQLFNRAASGFTLTKSGLSLLGPAREMAAASARLSTLAAGQDAGLTGTVRITASAVVSHYLLPNLIANFRRKEPGIEVELVPSDTAENLLFREADLAIRMFRPTQLDVVTRKIAELPLALYATPDLLAQYGQPQRIDDLLNMPFVGFDRSELIVSQMRTMGLMVDRNFFGVRCDNQVTYWKLVCAGCGVGAMQCGIADATPAVERLSFQPNLPPLEVWLAAQGDMYRNAKVKRLWDFLKASFP